MLQSPTLLTMSRHSISLTEVSDVKKMEEAANDDNDEDEEMIPVSKLLAELRKALLIWTEETAKDLRTITCYNVIRSTYRVIRNLCSTIMYDADDANDDQKEAADHILSHLCYDFARIGSDLPPKDVAIVTLLPQTEEDNDKHLLIEEDIHKPEAIKDNMTMHLPTEEARPTQLLPMMEDVTELDLPQEVAKRQILPKTVHNDLILPPEAAPHQFLPMEASYHVLQSQEDGAALHLLKEDSPDHAMLQMDVTVPVLPQHNTQDLYEVVHDTKLQSKEDGANNDLVDTEFSGLPQTEVNDPVLPQMEPIMFGLPLTEVNIPEVSKDIFAKILPKEEDHIAIALAEEVLQESFSSLSIPAWCPSVPALPALPGTYCTCAAELQPVPSLVGTVNIRDPCANHLQSNKRFIQIRTQC